MESLLSCEQLVQVANIKFQKDEMIQTIKNLAQSGQFAARTDVVDGCRCGDGFPCCCSSSKDALVDSHLWFEKGSLADCCSERHLLNDFRAGCHCGRWSAFLLSRDVSPYWPRRNTGSWADSRAAWIGIGSLARVEWGKKLQVIFCLVCFFFHSLFSMLTQGFRQKVSVRALATIPIERKQLPPPMQFYEVFLLRWRVLFGVLFAQPQHWRGSHHWYQYGLLAFDATHLICMKKGSWDLAVESIGLWRPTASM